MIGKKREADSWISVMTISDGLTLSDIDNICEFWVSFYSDRFEASSVNLHVQAHLFDHLPAYGVFCCFLGLVWKRC